MKALRFLSTKARRVQRYRCEMFYGGDFLNTMVGMDIQLKLFGIWWITIIKYNYKCQSWDNDGWISNKKQKEAALAEII